MAELKSITGDEPYRGLGTNPPAMIPRPMGFWGRPRYAPTYGSAFMGGGPYYSPYGGGGRFTSISYSPYGFSIGDDFAAYVHLMFWLLGEAGPLPLGDPFANAVMGSAVDPSPYSPYSRRFSAALSSNTLTPFQDSPAPRPINTFGRTNTFTPSSFNAPTGSSGSVSLSEATGGGFYKGRGN
ncbi:hypothetical protein NECAME_05098 [Necator americanus]|uniref:Uncharacterized protein n=1 Tax=Necator americanus TaxID=51031 RepID=W2SMH0_NECAM|nr:hypothetical protein NECAME_05098 [Necator americanus]ETN69912.1 hypothetical protein NECAME_05098 [Necator americanus]